MPCKDCEEWDRLVVMAWATCECSCHARDKRREAAKKKKVKK